MDRRNREWTGLRVKEMSFRVVNDLLLRAHRALLRRYGIETTYCTTAETTHVIFEDCAFAYSSVHRGATGNLDYVGNAENGTREKLFQLMSPEDVFYDIGAHGGVFTITSRARHPGLQVYSFEPQPRELLNNLALNKMPAEHVFAVAVSDSAGELRMTTEHRSSNHVSQEGSLSVPSVRLDDFRLEKGLKAPDWVKIDIEGMELPALRGFAAGLQDGQPGIVCEINSLHHRYGTSTADLAAFLQELGYVITALGSDGFSRQSVEQIRKGDLSPSLDHNYWFFPESKLENYSVS